MATKYISTTGNDTTGDGSINNRWATLTKAVTSCANGDTIILGDGLYDEAAAVIPTRKNLTILPETDYGCTVRAATGTTRVFHCPRVSVGGSAYVFGKIILDANNAQANCVTVDSVDVVDSITFNGTKLLSPTTSFVSCTKLSNLTMNQGWVASATGSANFSLTPSSAGTYDITDGSVSVAAAAGASFQAVLYMPSMTGCEIRFEHNTVSVVSAAGTAVTGFYGKGGTGYLVADNSISVGGTTASATGVLISAHATIAVDSCVITNNTGSAGTVTPVGYGVGIGDDADAGPINANSISGIRVSGNTLNNFNHGVFLGWVTSGRAYGNKVNGSVIGVIGKHTITCEFFHNVVNKGVLTSGALRSKAGNADNFSNNTAVLAAGVSSIGIMATDSSTGVKASNNIIVADGSSVANIVRVDVGSDAAFNGNCYWVGATPAADAWLYQGTGYTTLAAWFVAARDTESIYINPTLHGLFVSKSSPCAAAGIQIIGAHVMPARPRKRLGF